MPGNDAFMVCTVQVTRIGSNGGNVMLSRQDFFKQCMVSLGKSLLEVHSVVSMASVQAQSVAARQSLPPKPSGNMIAITRNRFCLARGGGCSTCLEQCKQEAIQLIPGEGTRIDPALCIGCGTCEKLCPAAPKGVQLLERSQFNESQRKE